MVREKRGFGINTQKTLDAASVVAEIATNKRNDLFVGSINVTLISTDKIFPDPKNPRKIAIKDLIINGLNTKDINYNKKKEQLKDKSLIEELEQLELLSESINNNGLLNPIVVYKEDDKYIIATGERRFLACLLLKAEAIPSKILQKKPNELQLRQIQWAENYNREDLSVIDKLNNIKQIVSAAGLNIADISIRKLAPLINSTKTHTARYLCLLKEDENSALLCALKDNQITSLKTAEYITSITDPVIKEKLIIYAKAGESLNSLKRREEALSTDSNTNELDKEKLKITLNASDLRNFLLNLYLLPQFKNLPHLCNNEELKDKKKLLKTLKAIISSIVIEKEVMNET